MYIFLQISFLHETIIRTLQCSLLISRIRNSNILSIFYSLFIRTLDETWSFILFLRFVIVNDASSSIYSYKCSKYRVQWATMNILIFWFIEMMAELYSGVAVNTDSPKIVTPPVIINQFTPPPPPPPSIIISYKKLAPPKKYWLT